MVPFELYFILLTLSLTADFRSYTRYLNIKDVTTPFHTTVNTVGFQQGCRICIFFLIPSR